MRLLGNKSRLLGDIEGFLRDKRVSGGTFIDIFCGTAGVGRHFKEKGFRVLANDRLSMCYTKAVATVEVSRYPAFRELYEKYRKVMTSKAFREAGWKQAQFSFSERARRAPRQPKAAQPLRDIVQLLNTCVEPLEGLIFRNFCPSGKTGRMYFSDENGKRIDGILHFLRENFRLGVLSRHELYLLLSALLDAADRVANISGTYGAYLKRFQASACVPLALRLPEVVRSAKKHQAFQEDANVLIRELRGDVLYIDPPYNTRQYAANYHVLEILSEFHTIDDVDAYEKKLYGKTGLRPYAELKSSYCVPASRSAPNRQDVLKAMTDLVLSSRVKHVLISYNEEGLLSREALGGILALFSGKSSFNFKANMREVLFRRFRSDSDRLPGEPRGRRKYKVIEGRKPDEICEWLLFASRPARRAPAKASSRARAQEPA